MLTFGSLFAGIGGIDLGLERAGMQCAWQVERDEWCRRVLAKHWPDVPRWEDVRDVGRSELGAVDVIAGGFPCQDVSLTGKRAGLEGERTTLWTEFARIICELRPRWVLAENVPGLLSSDDGRFFGSVLRDLAEIGYDAEWDCIPAAAVGAPHLRYRVFIVAYTEGSNAREQAEWQRWKGSVRRSDDSGGFEAERTVSLAHSNIPRLAQRQGERGDPREEQQAVIGSCDTRDVCDSPSTGLQNRQPGSLGESRQITQPERSDWWSVESSVCRVPDGFPKRLDELGGHWANGEWPGVPRVATGVPDRVNRLRGLGNAVVPQLAQWIGDRIVAADREAQC